MFSCERHSCGILEIESHRITDGHGHGMPWHCDGTLYCVVPCMHCIHNRQENGDPFHGPSEDNLSKLSRCLREGMVRKDIY